MSLLQHSNRMRWLSSGSTSSKQHVTTYDEHQVPLSKCYSLLCFSITWATNCQWLTHSTAVTAHAMLMVKCMLMMITMILMMVTPCFTFALSKFTSAIMYRIFCHALKPNSWHSRKHYLLLQSYLQYHTQIVGTYSNSLRQHLSLVHSSASLLPMINHTESCTSVQNMQQAVTEVCKLFRADSRKGISFTWHR